MSPSPLVDWLTFLAPSIPFWLLYLVGVVLALVTWKKHPGVSLLVFLGCGILLFTSVVGSVAVFWVIRQRIGSGWSIRAQSQALSAITICRTVLGLGGSILLLVAVFVGRARRPEPARPVRLDRDFDRPPHEPGHPGIQTTTDY